MKDDYGNYSTDSAEFCIINISTLLNMHTWWHWLAVLWSPLRLTLFNLVLTEHVNTVWRINVTTRTKREWEWRQRTHTLCVARVSPLRVNWGHRSLLWRAAINSPYNFKGRESPGGKTYFNNKRGLGLSHQESASNLWVKGVKTCLDVLWGGEEKHACNSCMTSKTPFKNLFINIYLSDHRWLWLNHKHAQQLDRQTVQPTQSSGRISFSCLIKLMSAYFQHPKAMTHFSIYKAGNYNETVNVKIALPEKAILNHSWHWAKQQTLLWYLGTFWIKVISLQILKTSTNQWQSRTIQIQTTVAQEDFCIVRTY